MAKLRDPTLEENEEYRNILLTEGADHYLMRLDVSRKKRARYLMLLKQGGSVTSTSSPIDMGTIHLELFDSESAVANTPTAETPTAAAEREWACKACTFLNHEEIHHCEVCGTKR